MREPKITATFILVAASLVAAPPTFSQERLQVDNSQVTSDLGTELSSEAKAEKKQLANELSDAVLRVAELKTLHLHATVKLERPDAGETQGTRIMVIRGAKGTENPSFEGELEIVKNSNDELIASTQNELPGLQIYDDGHRSIVKTAFDTQDVFSTEKLTNVLPAIMDWKSLARHIARSTEITKSENNERTIYRCQLSKRLLKDMTPQSDNLMVTMAPRPIRGEAVFEFAKDKLLKTKITIVQSDPMAAVRRKAAKSGGHLERFSVSGRDHTIEGDRWIYEFTVLGDAPSDRIKEFATEMRKLAK